MEALKKLDHIYVLNVKNLRIAGRLWRSNWRSILCRLNLSLIGM